MCNHDIKSSNCTLRLLPQRTFVVPANYSAQCEVCKKIFSNLNQKQKDQLIQKQ